MKRQPRSTVAPSTFSFRYDAVDRLIGSSSIEGLDSRRFYHNDDVRNERVGTNFSSHIRSGAVLLASLQGEATPRVVMPAEDAKGTPLFRVSGDEQGQPGREHLAYLPYGGAEAASNRLPAFNGELAEALTGWYLLGNGYRAYNPQAMRFQSPDAFSPFGGGGVNPYAYCVGDPINYADPTGQTPWWMWGVTGIGVGLSIMAVLSSAFAAASLLKGVLTPTTMLAGVSTTAGLAGIGVGITGIALDETEPDSGVQNALGFASLGLGILSAGAAGLSGAAGRRAKPNSKSYPIDHTITVVGDAKVKGYKTHDEVVAHGSRFATQAEGIVSGGKLGSLLRAGSELGSANPERVVKLRSCYSAVGGKASQAQRLADKLGRPVVGFHGKVTDAYESEVGNSKRFEPQTGLSAARNSVLNGSLSRVSQAGLAIRNTYRSINGTLYDLVRRQP